jgi:hypothetical protein
MRRLPLRLRAALPCAILIAALAGAIPPSAAEPRTALIEVFGSPECAPCAEARAAAATIAAENGAAVTWTEYPVATASPLGGADADARFVQYGSPSLPAVFVDGMTVALTGAGPEADLRAAVAAARALPSPLELDALFFFEPESRIGSVIVDVTAQEAIDDVTHWEILPVVVEDPAQWCCGAGGESSWPRVARMRIPPVPLGVASPGERQARQVDFQFDAAWSAGDLTGLALVQRVSDRTVMQAVEGRLAGTLPPLPPLPNDPDSTSLLPPRPNPALGAATLEFFLPEPGWAQLRILDVRGALVRELTAGPRTAGRHPFFWDGTDWRGRPRATGVYLVVLETSTVRTTRRLVLLR